MTQPKEDTKEIQLFGEKSIREEAYRQKILELEKELARLESLAKDTHVTNLKTDASTAKISELYYDSLINFDKRIKKEQEFIERRTSEATERLDLQAQRLMLNMELMLRKKARWFIISLFITMFLMVSLSIAAIFIYMNNKVTPAVSKQDNNVIKEDNGLERELAYLKNILQGQTKYQHQYSLVYLKLINGRYIGRFELNFYPDDKWYLKTLAADIINLFRKHNNGMLCEFSFSYKGKIYLKTVLTEFPPKLIHHFS